MQATQRISCFVYSTYYVSTTMWCFVNFAQLKPEENNRSWTWAFWWNKRLAREMISVPWNFGRGVNELSVMLSFNGNPVDVTRWQLGAWNADGFFLSFELALDDLSLKWNLRCVLKVFSLKLLFWWFLCIILTQKSNTWRKKIKWKIRIESNMTRDSKLIRARISNTTSGRKRLPELSKNMS